jgi:1-acyl-sn-glycerol-3-phosphate acyltransferase
MMRDSAATTMIKVLKLLTLNITFYLGFLVFSLAAIPCLTLLVACMAPFVGHRQAMRWFHRAIQWYGFVVVKILPSPLVRVRSETDVPGPAPVPCIIVCNHRSASDPFLMAALPAIGVYYDAVQVVNVWPFRIPVLGLYAKFAGYLSVNEMPVEAFYAAGKNLLGRGVSIISFPEGHRSTDRRMKPFHSAVFRLAMMTGTPIVPVCISGNERVPAKGSLLLRPGTVTLRRLPTVQTRDSGDLSPFVLKKRVWDAISTELEKMDAKQPPEH